jgi:hypothetical protein
MASLMGRVGGWVDGGSIMCGGWWRCPCASSRYEAVLGVLHSTAGAHSGAAIAVLALRQPLPASDWVAVGADTAGTR